jgi:hypothetical protein
MIRDLIHALKVFHVQMQDSKNFVDILAKNALFAITEIEVGLIIRKNLGAWTRALSANLEELTRLPALRKIIVVCTLNEVVRKLQDSRQMLFGCLGSNLEIKIMKASAEESSLLYSKIAQGTICWSELL